MIEFDVTECLKTTNIFVFSKMSTEDMERISDIEIELTELTGELCVDQVMMHELWDELKRRHEERLPLERN